VGGGYVRGFAGASVPENIQCRIPLPPKISSTMGLKKGQVVHFDFIWWVEGLNKIYKVIV